MDGMPAQTIARGVRTWTLAVLCTACAAWRRACPILVCAFVCAFVSAFVCSFRGSFACVLSWVEILCLSCQARALVACSM